MKQWTQLPLPFPAPKPEREAGAVWRIIETMARHARKPVDESGARI